MEPITQATISSSDDSGFRNSASSQSSCTSDDNNNNNNNYNGNNNWIFSRRPPPNNRLLPKSLNTIYDLNNYYHYRRKSSTPSNLYIENRNNNNNNNNNNNDRNIDKQNIGVEIDNRCETLLGRIRANLTGGAILRTIIVIGFVIWFFYNSIKIYREFENRETIIYLDYRTPNTSKPPAISICTHCILCDNGTIPIERYTPDDLLSSRNAFKKLGIETPAEAFLDLVIECRIAANSYADKELLLPCTEFVPRIRSLQNGQLCHTYFSDVVGETSAAIAVKRDKSRGQLPLLRYDQESYIKLMINSPVITGSGGAGFEAQTSFTVQGVYIMMHDPTIYPFMASPSEHKLYPNKSMLIPFEKRIQRLLPAPYESGCVVYGSSYDKNRNNDQNGKNISEEEKAKKEMEAEIREADLLNAEADPRRHESRGECFRYCVWRTLNRRSPHCSNMFAIYTETFISKWNVRRPRNESRPFCALTDRTTDESQYSLYQKTAQDCLRLHCPSPCDIETFTIQQSMIERYEFGDKNNFSLVQVLWAIEPIVYVDWRPKWRLEEFLGELGGHAHIWLGISVLRLANFAVRVASAAWRRIRARFFAINLIEINK